MSVPRLRDWLAYPGFNLTHLSGSFRFVICRGHYMSYIGSIGSLTWVAVILCSLAATMGSVLLLRSANEKQLVGLSLLALLLALIFTPILRVLPEEAGLPFFLLAFMPTLAIIVLSLGASFISLVRTSARTSFLNLILSLLAVGLFIVNATTPLIWSFRAY